MLMAGLLWLHAMLILGGGTHREDLSSAAMLLPPLLASVMAFLRSRASDAATRR